MKKSSIVILILMLSALGVFFGGTSNVLAGGWSGTGSNKTVANPPGGSCGNTITEGAGWAISCDGGGLAWVYYSIPSGKTSEDIYLPYPHDRATMNEAAVIDKQCANNGNGGGFWAFGHRATNISYYGVKTIDVSSPGIQSGDISDDQGDSTRFTGLWGPAAFGADGKYNDGGSPNQVLGNYVAQSFGSTATVLKNYNTYLEFMGESKVDSLPSGLYAFCYWSKMENVSLTVRAVTEGGDVIEYIENEKQVTPNSVVPINASLWKRSYGGVEYGFIGWKLNGVYVGYNLNYEITVSSNTTIDAVYGQRKVSAHAILLGSSRLEDGVVVDSAGDYLPGVAHTFRTGWAAYDYTASVWRTSKEGFSFLGWVLKDSDVNKASIPYIGNNSNNKYYTSSYGTTANGAVNVQNLTQNTDVYAVYKRSTRKLNIISRDSDGNLLSDVPGLEDKVITELYGTPVYGERGTNSKWRFKGFSTDERGSSVISGNGAAKHIASEYNGWGNCVGGVASGCPWYHLSGEEFMFPSNEEKTVYAVYESLERELTVESDENSWVQVIRNKSSVGESTGVLVFSDYDQNNIIREKIYVGDKLTVYYYKRGCSQSTGFDYEINEHTLDGTPVPSGYSWVVSKDHYVKINSKDQSKVLTAKWYTTDGIRLWQNEGDTTVRVCYGYTASVTRRESTNGFTFVGWKDTLGGAYLDNTIMPGSGYWLSGNRDGSTNPELNRSYGTYSYANMTQDKTILGIYAYTYDGLKVYADAHSKAYVYRTSSPDAGAPSMSAAGMDPRNCPSGSPCAYRDHVIDNTMPDSMVVYKGDVLAIGMDRDDCYHWQNYNGTEYGWHVVGPAGSANLEVRGGTTKETKAISFNVFGEYVVQGGTEVRAATTANSHTLFEKGYDIDSGGRLTLGDGSKTEYGCPTISLDRQLVGGYKFLGWQHNSGQRTTDGMIENQNPQSLPYISNIIEEAGKTSPVYYKGNRKVSIFKTINYIFKSGTSDEYDGVNKEYYAYYAKKYNLSVTTGICSKVSVERTSSKYAALGTLANGSTIYNGDILRVVFSKDGDCGCFDMLTHSINNNNNYNIGTFEYTVSGDTSIEAGSYLRQYTLHKHQATGTGVSVKRTASPYTARGVIPYLVSSGQIQSALTGKAGTTATGNGNLNDNAAIYCGDRLDTKFTLDTGYSWGEYGHSERGWHFMGNGRNEWGPNNDSNDSKEILNHIVNTDVTAETRSQTDCGPDGCGTVTRNAFQGRASVYEESNDKRSNSTGWTETSKSAPLNDIKCLNYGTNGGCPVNFKLDLKTLHGTGSTSYVVQRQLNGGAWTNVGNPASYRDNSEKNIFDRTDTIYPGQMLCYQVVFRPYGTHPNNESVVAMACAKAEVSEFQGKTTISSPSGTTSNGFTKGTNAIRIVHNVNNCSVDGCKVTFTHDLKRDKGIGWTSYKVSRTSNYPSKIALADNLKSGTEYFRDANPKQEYKEELTLYPGTVVCETLRFKSENNYAVQGGETILTTCASALGKAQPDDPQDKIYETLDPDGGEDPRDPDGDIPDLPSGDNALLNIKVKNNDKTGSNYAKVTYAKPGDSVQYRATYNPRLQYTYHLAPEKIQIDGGAVYPINGKNQANLMWNMFNSYRDARRLNSWNNAFSVYSVNFTSGQTQLFYSPTDRKNDYVLGDTSSKSETNKHTVADDEVGKSLIEFARINYDIRGNNPVNSSVKTTPTQVIFADNGGAEHYNRANVITAPISRNAFARIPYNFITIPKVTDDNTTAYSGEDLTIKYEIGIGEKRNCLTTNCQTEEDNYATKADNVKHRIIVYDPSGTTVGENSNGGVMGGGRDADVCSGYFRFGSGYGQRDCAYSEDKTTGSIPRTGTTGESHFNVRDMKAGSKICVAVAVYPATSGAESNWNNTEYDGTWKVSPSKCYTIAKKPSFQAWGGNVYAAGKIDTSSAKKGHVAGYNDSEYSVTGPASNYHVFGSWGELGVISGGAIPEFGSGASMGYSGIEPGGGLLPRPNDDNSSRSEQLRQLGPGGYFANNSQNTRICNRSRLTFANGVTTNSGCSEPVGLIGGEKGKSQAQNDKSAIVARFSNVDAEALTGTELGTFMNDLTGEHYFRASGNVTIGVNSLKRNSEPLKVNTVFLRVTGNLTINGNLTYEGGSEYKLMSDIPKLIVYVEKSNGSGGNINISCDVTRVDAMLIADGTVDTCSDGGDDRNSNRYSKQLVIFGAVIADHITLKRTYGAAAGFNSIIPAEIINYDPTLYLWGSRQAEMSKTGTLDVTYTMELSPRYGEKE